MNRRITLISGGFDPIHSGHVDLITHAGDFGLTIALNSDEWLIRKKGNYFLPWEERYRILRAMNRVGNVIKFNDDDDSACDAIEQIKERYPESSIHFYNGGDRSEGNILEALRYSDDPLVTFHYGCGGAVKSNASSDVLSRWVDLQKQTTERNWGEYNVLAEYPGVKVKTLTVKPGQSLSMQQHKFRNEHWFVVSGEATVDITERLTDMNGTKSYTKYLQKHDLFTIPTDQWHLLHNKTEEELLIVEIQYGEKCEESDIVRKVDK